MSAPGLETPSAAPPRGWSPGAALAALSDARLVALVGLALFVLAAWPLLLVPSAPFQDLPNHLATAHIVAHPELYPELTFNGLFKSNSLLTLWLYLVGGHGLYGAGRLFTAFVLAANAFALPLFVLRFAGRRAVPVAALFLWPLVHGFTVSMGFLNFSFAFALSLVLLVVIDRQRERPTGGRAARIALLAGAVWYAHPFPLAVMGALVAADVARRPGWPARLAAGRALLLPLLPAGALALMAAQHHLVKAEHSTAAAATFSYLNPWENLEHLWLDASGAFTRWGTATAVPAILLPIFAWRNRRLERPFFTSAAVLGLLATYVALPEMLSNWNYLNCRLVPFIWVGLGLRLPDRLPRAAVVALALSAVAFSTVLGVDYLRLDRERVAFTAGIDAVPRRATLLPLLFEHRRTSVYTASLTHAWGYYTIERDASAPLVFGVERTYPITYREFPPRALIPPALDRFAELNGTPARICATLKQPPGAPACEAAWRAMWESFWQEAEPRFSHLLTWAMPPEARTLIPARYRRVFAAGPLEIYARRGSGN
ncbi:MAG TPA: hypothetical protein VHO06_20980 [Polyangia bacterium]|nr:hypothetical protein [Polyangia bacterium]